MLEDLSEFIATHWLADVQNTMPICCNTFSFETPRNRPFLWVWPPACVLTPPAVDTWYHLVSYLAIGAAGTSRPQHPPTKWHQTAGQNQRRASCVLCAGMSITLDNPRVEIPKNEKTKTRHIRRFKRKGLHHERKTLTQRMLLLFLALLLPRRWPRQMPDVAPHRMSGISPNKLPYKNPKFAGARWQCSLSKLVCFETVAIVFNILLQGICLRISVDLSKSRSLPTAYSCTRTWTCIPLWWRKWCTFLFSHHQTLKNTKSHLQTNSKKRWFRGP